MEGKSYNGFDGLPDPIYSYAFVWLGEKLSIHRLNETEFTIKVVLRYYKKIRHRTLIVTWLAALLSLYNSLTSRDRW